MGDRLYLEVQPYAAPAQRVFNDWAFDLHDREGVQIVATNDVHYIDRSDAEVHPFFIMAGMGAWQRKGGDGYNDQTEKYVSKPGGNHYRSRSEMFDAFAALHGAGILGRRGLQAAMDAPFDIYARAAAVRFDTDLKIPILKIDAPAEAPSV
jgi:DNA polymerase III alpha subunit